MSSSPEPGPDSRTDPKANHDASPIADRAAAWGFPVLLPLLMLDILAGALLLLPPEAVSVLPALMVHPPVLWPVHGACAAGQALCLYPMLPRSLRQTGRPRRAGLTLLFALCFLLPLCGALALFFGIGGGLLQPRRRPGKTFDRSGIAPLPFRPHKVSARPEYDDGALSSTLRASPDPDRRMQAVMTARALRDPTDVTLLRLALTDKVDDVRLLAYSMLDRREQALSRAVQSLQAALAAATEQGAPPARRALLHRRLAQAQFEIVYLGLGRGEIQRFLLAETQRHLHALLQINPDDRGGLFLLGRVLLRLLDLAGAEAAFLRARDRGLDPARVLPYLAEIALRKRKPAKARAALLALGPERLRTQPALQALAQNCDPALSPAPPGYPLTAGRTPP